MILFLQTRSRFLSALLGVLLVPLLPGFSSAQVPTVKVGIVTNYTAPRTSGPLVQGSLPAFTTQVFTGPIRGYMTGHGQIRGRFEVNFSTTVIGTSGVIQSGVWYFLATDTRGRIIGILAGNVSNGRAFGTLPITFFGSGVFPGNLQMALIPSLGAGMFANAEGTGLLTGFCIVTNDGLVPTFFDSFNGRVLFELDVPTTAFRFR